MEHRFPQIKKVFEQKITKGTKKNICRIALGAGSLRDLQFQSFSKLIRVSSVLICGSFFCVSEWQFLAEAIGAGAFEQFGSEGDVLDGQAGRFEEGDALILGATGFVARDDG